MARQPRVQLVIDGKDNTKNAFGAISQSLNALEQKTASVGRAMVGAFAGLVSVSTLKSIGAINSEWVDMSSRLRRVTKDEAEFAVVTERLGEVAESTWSGLNETIESYLSMQGPLADMGYTTEEQVNFVSALNNALVVSGAKKEVAASVQNALNKAMAGGVLRGENLNTVIEKGGRVAELLASTLGVTVSELRSLGTQGKITGEVMYSALAGNMQLLSEEAEAMPAAFEDAMQRVDESIKGAFRDDELMAPLTDSLLDLAEVLKDPATQQGLSSLAKIVVGTATNVASATTELGYLNETLTYFGRVITGDITKVEMLNEEIKDLDRAINKTGRLGRFTNFIFGKESLEQQKAEIVARREAIINEETGTTAEMRAEEEKRQAMFAESQAQERAALRKHAADVGGIKAEMLKDAETYLKDLVAVEKTAKAAVDKARKAQLDTETRYQDALKKLRKGGKEEEPTYALAQGLSAKARQALAAEDTDKAKEYAQEALDVLLKISDAGGNTYGFEGFINSLKEIEKGADKINTEKAQAEFDDVVAKIESLKETIGELKSIDMRVALDEKSIKDVEAYMRHLAETIGKDYPILMQVGGGVIEPQAEAESGRAAEKVVADVKRKIYRDGNSFTDKPLVLAVEPEPVDKERFKELVELPELEAGVQLDDESVGELSSDLEAMVDRLKAVAVIPVKVVADESTSTESAPGFASGGHIKGAGTGTSDSILARLSNGEYVVRAAAVRKYGLQTLHAMNNMHLPKFADGGLVDRVSNMQPPQQKNIGSLNFHLPSGDAFSVDVAGTSNLDDLHRAALKYGRTRK